MWWEKRGGGTAEGATRRETCAVSSATAARWRNSPGREPQCDPRARPESCDPLESVVSPLAPEPGVESTNEPPETTYPRMPARSRVTRSRSFAETDVTTNPSMLCTSGSSTRRARPLRKWLETGLGRWKRSGGAISFFLGAGDGEGDASLWKCRKKERDQKLGSLSTCMWVGKGWNQKGLYNLGLILHLRR